MNSIITSKDKVVNKGFFIFFIICLAMLSIYNYLLFHSIVELFSSVIALFVFIMCVNTYDIIKSNQFLILGIGYFWVAIIDLFHTASFPGVGILEYTSVNMTTQFSLAARYIAVFTILTSVILVNRPIKRFRSNIIFIGYSLVSICLIISIYYFKVFPTCFVEGKGLTGFKVGSEIVIFGIYIFTAILYFRVKRRLEHFKVKYVILTCVISGLSELFFTNYTNGFDWTNVVGHILKVIAFYCMYKGIVEIGLKRPYSSINNNLKSKEMELDFIGEMLKKESFKRRDIEEMVISNEKCYEMLVKYSRDAIIVHRNGKYIFANDGAAKLFGAENVEELIDMPVSSFIHYDSQGLSKQRIREIHNRKCSLPFVQMKALRADGEVIDIEVASAYYTYKGEPSILTIGRDISYIKQVSLLKKDIELTKEFNRVLTEFFSNISHELKTPLNVILGAIQVLGLPQKKQGSSDFEVKVNKYLKTMKQNCYRLLRLVNNLIDQSKIDSGYLKPNLKNLDVVKVVEDITLSVADYAENKGIEIIFDTDTEEKIMAFDADKIERILLNLLSNSMKFVSQGGEILVNLYDKKDKIIISVKDTGVGIPEDKLKLIFDRFGQVDKTLARNKEGSGIGLSLVKSLVDMHEGTITVNSRFGEGSEFIIELPVYITDIEDEVLENSMYQSNVERISIEFSDIYS